VGRRLDESRFTKTDAHTVAQDDAPPRQFPPEWGPGCEGDLIVTLDDATNENYSAFFSRERGGQPVPLIETHLAEILYVHGERAIGCW
jgi:hypothetical protein